MLDVGGSPLIWEFARVRPHLTMLNLPSAVRPGAVNADFVAGDGRYLPFKDSAFDIVFSNSVIEHVGTRADQQLFANEVSRVGRYYWIQTPNRHFPIEPHVMLPFVHYLPKSWQKAIVNRFTVWELVVHPSDEERDFYLHHFLNDLRSLEARELQNLFPDATIITEQTIGLAKSLVALRA